MWAFVTGASGHIGTAVVSELIRAGHRVVGLARSDSSAAVLDNAGAQVERATLDDLDALQRAADAADGVIHLAYMHDAPEGVDPAAADLGAIEAIGDGLKGTGKPFVGTSGTLVLTPGRVATEQDAPDPKAPAVARVKPENTVVGLAEQGVRSSIVRLPPAVHSSLDHHGFLPSLIAIARDKGVAAYVGDGENRWPAVHTLDAARLFRMALEAAPAGSRWHGVDDERVPFREIAEVIGRHLDVRVVSVPLEEAETHFGWLSFAVAADNPTSSALTRQSLGWQTEHSGLIADLDQGHYFDT